MEFSVNAQNVQAVVAAIVSDAKKFDLAIEYGVAQVGLAGEGLAKKMFDGKRKQITSKSGSVRIDPPFHKPNSTGGPNVITGNLRQSIHTTVRKGFGTYTADVTPGMIYARAVELGGKNWQGKPWANGGYPYMTPAYEKLRPQASRIFLAAVNRRMQ